MSELSKRIQTALLLGVGTLMLIFLAPPLWMQGALALMAFLSLYEWGKNICQVTDERLMVAWMGGIIMSFLWIRYPVLWSLPVLFWLIWAPYWLYRHRGDVGRPKPFDLWLGTFVISWFIPSLWHLWLKGPWWVVSACMLPMLVDIGAYFGGKRWGSHHPVPGLSPNKTFEGYAIGYGVGFVFFLLLGLRMYGQYSGLALILPFLALVGDLWESGYKRRYHVKDSGALLPGHGGWLDRLDSLFPVVSVFAAYDLWYSHI